VLGRIFVPIEVTSHQDGDVRLTRALLCQEGQAQGKAHPKPIRGQPHSMCIPAPLRPRGEQRQQDRGLVKDSPTMITRATTVQARCLLTPDGTRNTIGAQTSPRAQTPSRPKQNSPLGQNSALPEPGLGYLVPHESRRRPVLQL
jgi:hypothetical protein